MADDGPLILRRKLLGAATETTKGVAETVAAALSGTIVYNATMQPGDIYSNGQRLPNRGSTGSIPRTKGMQVGTCTFRTEMIAGDAFLTTLILGCGFTVSTSVATPSADRTAHKTLTLVLWEGGRKKTLHGASGRFRLTADRAGNRVFADWTFSGIYNDVADQAMPSDPGVTTKGWRARGMTLTAAGGSIPYTSGFTLDAGVQVEERESQTATHGISHYFVADILPTLSLDPEARTVADYDQHGKFIAGTAEAYQLVLTDGTNTLTIDAPKGQRTTLGDGSRGSKLTDPIELDLHVDSGNDQVKFTEA